MGAGLPASKLRPATERLHGVPPRLREALAPRPGRLTLVHASAGYGKTTALAASDEPGAVWYNLDTSDCDPAVFARRLGQAMRLDPPGSATLAELAWRLAEHLQGGPAMLTLDRWERLARGEEVGRLLEELISLAPTLTLRLATRIRPALPLERMRLEGRLIELGPGELRLQPAEIESLLTTAWVRAPNASELDFADNVLAGWPAGLRLWMSSLGSAGPLTPLLPGQLLREYFREQVLGMLPDAVEEQMRREWRWLLRPGPLLERATTSRRFELVSRLVRERVAVVPGPGGWHLHPLLLALDRSAVRDRGGPAYVPTSHRAPAGGDGRVEIRTFGRLSVLVDGMELQDGAWPASSRRLLELLLSQPGARTTAEEAARLLWPGAPVRAARNSFNVGLHGLRRALEPDLASGPQSRYVVREGRDYRLRLERLSCDAEEFMRLVRDAPAPLDETGARRLQAAADLHVGDFLASCGERFAAARRGELRALLLSCAERLGKWHAEAEGDLLSAC